MWLDDEAPVDQGLRLRNAAVLKNGPCVLRDKARYLAEIAIVLLVEAPRFNHSNGNKRIFGQARCKCQAGCATSDDLVDVSAISIYRSMLYSSTT